MKANEFIDRLGRFAVERICPKCSNPMTQMIIGASTCGVGRRILETKLAPILGMCAAENGELDIPGMRESVLAGAQRAKSVPLLGGAISLDAKDAEEFFDYISG